MNSGGLPVRITPTIGPGGSWLSVEGDFVSPMPPYSQRTFILSVDRSRRTTADGPPPLSTVLRIENIDGNPADAAVFFVFDEEPLPPVPGTNRSNLGGTEFSLILGSSVSTTQPASSRGLRAASQAQYFSDGWIRNRSSSPVAVDLYFTPDGAEGITDPRVKKNTLTLQGYTAYRLSDFVQGLFGESGSGQVELRSTQLPQLTVRSTVDTLFSREGALTQYGGEVPLWVSGQGVVVPGEGTGEEVIVLGGLKGPLSGYRSTVICSETSGESIVILARLYDTGGKRLGEKSVSINAYSKIQISSTDPDLFPVPYSEGTVEITPVSGKGTVSAFATVLDNTSQSYATRLGTILSRERAPSKALRAESKAYIPTIARELTSDAFYTTRLSITNGTEADATIRVTYIPEPGFGEIPEPKTLVIPKRVEIEGEDGPKALSYGDAVKDLLGIEDMTRGMLKFEGELTGLVFASETTTPIDLSNPDLGYALASMNPAPGADPNFPGAFTVNSQEVLGVKLTDTDTVKQEVSLPAIEDSPDFRTNLVLAELGGESARVKVVLRKTGGAALGEPLTVNLAPNERRQINRIILEIVKPPAGVTDFKDIEIAIQAVAGKGRAVALVNRIANDPASKRVDTYVLGANVTGAAKRGGKK